MRWLSGVLFLSLIATILIGCGRSPVIGNPGSLVPVKSWFRGEPETVTLFVEETVLDEIGDNDLLPLRPVVQFGCWSAPHPIEDSLEAGLQGSEDGKRLAALDRLVEVFAPSSVALQYAAYLDLKEKYPQHASVLAASQAFNREWISSVVFRSAPADEYSSDSYQFYWCIRAAGVLKMRELLPRLLELSAAGNLYTTLAAERSIEDFDGPEGEEALLHVISLWKYNAFQHAAAAMIERNPERLSYTLEQIAPPAKYHYSYALILARCGNAKAVPHL